MTVRRLDERSVEVTCPTCRMKFTMPTHEYRTRIRVSTDKKVYCTTACHNKRKS